MPTNVGVNGKTIIKRQKGNAKIGSLKSQELDKDSVSGY